MKKCTAFLLILSIMFVLIPVNAATYGWIDGAIVLGTSQYKIVLPDGFDPIEPFPNELGAAMTKEYGPPDGMGITVQIMGEEPESSAAFQYKMVMEYDEANYTAKKKYTPNKSDTAFDDWVETLGGKDYTLYVENSTIPVKGLDLNYVFSMNNHLPDNVIQGSAFFYIPGETACYCVFVSSLYQITGGDVHTQMTEFREKSIYYIDTILQYAQGSRELENLQSSQTNVGIKKFDTSGLSGSTAHLAELYNITVDSIAEGHLDIVTTGELLFYSDQDQSTVLRPMVYECATGFVNGIYDVEVDSTDTEVLLQSLWDIIGNLHDATVAGENVSPVFDVETFEDSDIHPKQILSDTSSDIDAVVFGLQDSNGNWIENAVYLLIRIPGSQNTILCLVNDQQLIEEYLVSIGQTLAELPSELQYAVVEDYRITDTIEISPVEYSNDTTGGYVWFDEHNRLVEEMESGCQVFDTDEYQFVWSIDESQTVLHPMMLVLGEGSEATELPESAITEDWRHMIQIVLEHAQSGQIDPMKKDVLMRLVTGEVTPEALFYGNDQSEYLVFMLTDSQTMEPVEDQLYAVLRMVSSGGTTHLTLITDQTFIQNEVQSAIAQNSSNHQSFVPGAYVPVIEDQFSEEQKEPSINTKEVYSYACDQLLDNAALDSYMQSVFDIVQDLQDDGVHQFSKGLYDFLTDPKGELGEAFLSYTTDRDQQISEDLMYDILCEMLSSTSVNRDFQLKDNVEKTASQITKIEIDIIKDLVAKTDPELFEDLPFDVNKVPGNASDLIFVLDTLYEMCNWASVTEQEANRLMQISNNYYSSIYHLLTIRNRYADFPFVVSACDRLINDLNDTFTNQDVQKYITEKGLEETMNVSGTVVVDGLLDLIGDKNPIVKSFLVGGEIGAILTNQSAVLSEKEDLMVYMSYIDKVVTSRTRSYRDSDDVYTMLLLQAAVQKRGLQESKQYYEAYNGTFVGKWNTIFNGFDIDRIREGIDKQYQKINQIMNDCTEANLYQTSY